MNGAGAFFFVGDVALMPRFIGGKSAAFLVYIWIGKTTEIYTHASTQSLQKIRSPIDEL